MSEDEDHLGLLTVFHYVLAGLGAVFSMFPLIHLGLGLMLALHPEKLDSHGSPPSAFIGWFFVAVASVIILMGLTFAVFVFFAGRSLAKRKGYTFCLVMAGIECAFFPFGTALGVFTLIVLCRPSVKAIFKGAPPPIPVSMS
jgi:hypothetical protein